MKTSVTRTYQTSDLPNIAASQTADEEDKAGGGHGTDHDDDGADAADGAQ